jgi:hypothetical protein
MAPELPPEPDTMERPTGAAPSPHEPAVVRDGG